ncbi:hypothetical protein HOLleu_18316 [Holothuria leucospilota]|uniref:Uncharacterized protein n=1 Tax=Holothuria leucospilota TaxID=206669 RepID=A0A9Q1C3G6_HOLLE|nr:hypothetical protein HOLleu_18316 [Holothuria leucospilota]
MAASNSTEQCENTLTLLDENASKPSCSKSMDSQITDNHLEVKGDKRKQPPAGKSFEASSCCSSGSNTRKGHKPINGERRGCSVCTFRNRFHLFSVFRYIFIGVVFVTWLAVTVSICIMAFSYAFSVGMVAIFIVFLQILPVLAICIATYGNCCGICDGNRGKNIHRSHILARNRRNDEQQKTMIANFTIVMPTVVVSQATDSPVMSMKGTSC